MKISLFKLIYRPFLVCTLVFYTIGIHAQNISDSLRSVRDLIAKDNQQQALSTINNTIAGEAQTASGLLDAARKMRQEGRPGLSGLYFEKLLLLHPDNNEVRLEYAGFLYQQSELEVSANLLEQYIENGGSAMSALEMLGQIRLWHSAYDEAEYYFDEILKRDPSNTLALSGLEEIQAVLSPYLQSFIRAEQDDQPLERAEGELHFKMYKNGWLAPNAQVLYHYFDHGRVQSKANALWAQVGNQFNWNKQNMTLDVKAGFFKLSEAQAADWSYDLELVKKWKDWFTSAVEFSRMPYYTTLSSIEQQVILQHDKFSLYRPFSKVWNGELAVVRKRFSDGNKGINTYAYIMASLIQSNKFIGKLGYGFNYDDMEASRFSPVQSLDEIISFGIYEDIPGRYDPYFTPEMQMSHSLLLNMNWEVTNWLNFSAASNIGLYASSEVPFLFLNENAEGELEVERSFENLREDILEVRSGLDFQLSNNLQLGISGYYQSLFFYERFGFETKLNLRL